MNKKKVIIVVLVVLALVFSAIALAVSFGAFDSSSLNGSSEIKSPTGGVVIFVEQNPDIANNP